MLPNRIAKCRGQAGVATSGEVGDPASLDLIEDPVDGPRHRWPGRVGIIV